MQKRDRSYRRHHRNRMVEKAKRSSIVTYIAEDKEHLDLRAKVYADNLKKCGCEMCRNPRRSKKENRNHLRTLQEKISDINYKEQLMQPTDEELEDRLNKQTCAKCKQVVIPTKDNMNHCTVQVTHHYGSPKDGDVETYDICVKCVQEFFNQLQPLQTTNYLSLS